MAGRGINKVILIGNLGADPEVRYSQNSNAIANLSVATSETWKDKQTGEKREQTEWHRVVCYRRLAEIAGEYLRKGSKVYIEGRLQTRKWQDQQGNDKYTTEIVCNDLQMLDGQNNGGQGGGQQRGQGNQGGYGGQQSGYQGGQQQGGQRQGNQGNQPPANQGGYGGQGNQNQDPGRNQENPMNTGPTDGNAGGDNNNFDDDIPF